MDKFTFNTGREYSENGQQITVFNILETTNKMFDCPETLILMTDPVRGIDEFMIFWDRFEDIQEHQIIEAYDSHHSIAPYKIERNYGIDAITVKNELLGSII